MHDWQAAGVWQKIWEALLDELGLADAIGWPTSAMDSCSVRAILGGRRNWTPKAPRYKAENTRAREAELEMKTLILIAVVGILLAVALFILRSCLVGPQRRKPREESATPTVERDDINLPLFLKAFQLPTTIKCSASYALLGYETVNSRLNLRLRMSREQLKNVIQTSWMQTHGIPLGEAIIYEVGVPEPHKARTRKLWDVEPLQKNDKAFHLKLEGVGPDSVTVIVRESESVADVYLMRVSSSSKSDAAVLWMMHKGRFIRGPRRILIPPRVKTFEAQQGKFQE